MLLVFAAAQQPHQRRLVDLVAVPLLQFGQHLGQAFPLSLAGQVDQLGPAKHLGLVVVSVPFADPLVGPGRVVVRVAQVAGIGRLEGDGRGRSGRTHRMIGASHRRKTRHRHVAGDALVPLAPGRVVAVLRRLLHLLLVAGHAHLVRLLALETHPAAGRVAVVAVQLARLGAGAHEPRGVRVVLAQVAAVGIEVGMVQRDEIEVIEELVARQEVQRQRDQLRVAGGAHVVHLRGREILGANELDVFAPCACPPASTMTRMCSVPGPWQDSQLMPGSDQVVW